MPRGAGVHLLTSSSTWPPFSLHCHSVPPTFPQPCQCVLTRAPDPKWPLLQSVTGTGAQKEAASPGDCLVSPTDSTLGLTSSARRDIFDADFLSDSESSDEDIDVKHVPTPEVRPGMGRTSFSCHHLQAPVGQVVCLKAAVPGCGVKARSLHGCSGTEGPVWVCHWVPVVLILPGGLAPQVLWPMWAQNGQG